MTYKDALKIVNSGGRARRKAWQAGFIELGIFQDQNTIFYNNPVQSECDGYIIPTVYVTYTPYRTKPRCRGDYGYPEDELANDWEEVK